MIAQESMITDYNGNKENISAEKLIEALRFVEMFIEWSNQDSEIVSITFFTERYNSQKNAIVALQLLNLINKLGFEDLIVWLKKLEQQSIESKTKINIIQKFLIFFEKTEKSIGEWIQKNKLFPKKNTSTLKTTSTTTQIIASTYRFQQKQDLFSNYKFRKDMLEEEKTALMEIFKNIFIWVNASLYPDTESVVG